MPTWTSYGPSRFDPPMAANVGKHREGTSETTRTLAQQERADLAALLRSLTPEQWDAPSLCAGWRVRDVVAHVVSYEGLSAVALARRFAKGGFWPDRVNRRGGGAPTTHPRRARRPPGAAHGALGPVRRLRGCHRPRRHAHPSPGHPAAARAAPRRAPGPAPRRPAVRPDRASGARLLAHPRRPGGRHGSRLVRRARPRGTRIGRSRPHGDSRPTRRRAGADWAGHCTASEAPRLREHQTDGASGQPGHRPQTCRPHSTFDEPAQRPDRGSSPRATRRVHGAQPIEG